ncbi:L,D-transpeptidase, partial [Cribrihabitans sp. XS_ASV171]
MSQFRTTRRSVLLGAAATLATPALLRAQSLDAFPQNEQAIRDQVP